jgi:predicted urease superfamily metal-dependent hydrolase
MVYSFLCRGHSHPLLSLIQTGKEEVKLSLFADDMFLHLKDLKNSNKNLLDVINSFSKVAGYKINLQNSATFIYTNNGQTEKEYRKIIPQ